MADGAWPTDTTPISTTNMDADTDLLTAARADILLLTQKFNDVLNSIDDGAVPTSSLNDGSYMKAVTGTVANEICILNADGHPIRSQQTITTTLGTDNTTVPTSGAVNTAISASAGKAVVSGAVASDGTDLILPSGWSPTVRAGTAEYTLTHNLGHTNYVLVATAFGVDANTFFNSIELSDRLANTILITTHRASDGGTVAQYATSFHYMLQDVS